MFTRNRLLFFRVLPQALPYRRMLLRVRFAFLFLRRGFAIRILQRRRGFAPSFVDVQFGVQFRKTGALFVEFQLLWKRLLHFNARRFHLLMEITELLLTLLQPLRHGFECIVQSLHIAVEIVAKIGSMGERAFERHLEGAGECVEG